MTTSAVVYTDISDSKQAGEFLSKSVLEKLDGQSPDVLIVFASPVYEFEPLLEALSSGTRAKVIVGCSSAGEFTSKAQGESSISVMALRSNEMQFSAGLGKNLRENSSQAATEVLSGFRGIENNKYLYRSALILTDALAGFADDMIERLNLLTAANYRFFGGGAGDDAKFSKTHVFSGTKAYTDAVVALEILSNKPLGIGVRHGWEAASDPMRVTAAEGMRLISLNAIPAENAIREYAESTGQQFDKSNPLPFFLHNIIGIDTGAGHKLRVPLGVNPDGSISCAAEIPVGSIVNIMKASCASSSEAASSATEDAVSQLNGGKPAAALFFDCVATRLRMGKEFGMEMQALERVLDPAKYAGCNTYGQIAKAEGQFSGFHNCTAVVCVFPQ